jgi:hypothetical protein
MVLLFKFPVTIPTCFASGLGFGVLGGLTSVITEPLEGAYNDGVAGFFTGLPCLCIFRSTARLQHAGHFVFQSLPSHIPDPEFSVYNRLPHFSFHISHSSFHITVHVLSYPRAAFSYSIACRLIPRLPHPMLHPHIFQILVSSLIPFHVLSYPQTYCHLRALTAHIL